MKKQMRFLATVSLTPYYSVPFWLSWFKGVERI